MYLYMSECVYVFMYLYTCKSDKREREREREVPGRQFSCLGECCYFFPWLIIIISCKTDFDLQRFCPLNIGKQNVTTRNDYNFLMF